MRLIVAITGSSGAIYGIRLLQALREIPKIEDHLILSKGGKLTAALETGWKAKDIEKLAHHVHSDQDLAATISSGSFKTAGMIVAPCSMKTLSGIVNSYADNLVVRAADVVLKERRKLVLMPRETPAARWGIAGCCCRPRNWAPSSRRRCRPSTTSRKHVWTTPSTTASAACWTCSTSTASWSGAGREASMAEVGTKLIFENERVRVWEFTLQPGETIEAHKHDHAYFFYPLEGGTLEVTRASAG